MRRRAGGGEEYGVNLGIKCGGVTANQPPATESNDQNVQANVASSRPPLIKNKSVISSPFNVHVIGGVSKQHWNTNFSLNYTL